MTHDPAAQYFVELGAPTHVVLRTSENWRHDGIRVIVGRFLGCKEWRQQINPPRFQARNAFEEVDLD